MGLVQGYTDDKWQSEPLDPELFDSKISCSLAHTHYHYTLLLGYIGSA